VSTATGPTAGAAERDPAGSGPAASAHDAIDALLARVLEAPVAERVALLERLCAESPAHASELRARYGALAAVGLAGEAPVGDPFPSRLGDFRLLAPLGSGGMGVVYRAIEEPLQREVALKLIRPEHLFFPGAQQWFRREVEAIASVQHPAIVPIYRAGEAAGIPFFAMELVSGVSLAQVVRHVQRVSQERLTARDLAAAAGAGDAAAGVFAHASWIDACVDVVLQVSQALAHAHARGVIHRDVKPSNIMLTPEGRVRLLDFGLAARAGSSKLTRTGTAMGSLAYMSPEQVRGDPVDARTDVYSLGVTLYELLTLQEAFFDESSETLRGLILAGQAKPIRVLNRKVPWDVETVCLRAMAPQANHRYPSASAFAADLERLLARAPIAARRPGPWLRATRFVQRHPTLSAAAGLLALLCTVLPTALWLQQRSSNRAIRAALDRANAEAETTRRTLDFLVDSVRLADPERALGEAITVRQMIDDAAQRFGRELQDQPRVQATLLAALGGVYKNLGLFDEAARLLSACVPSLDQLDAPRARMARLELARVLRALGRLDDAEQTLRAAAEGRAPLPEYDARALRLERALLRHDRGERAAANAELDDVERACRNDPGAQAQLLDVLRARVRLLVRHGGYASALQRLPEVEALAARVLGDKHAVRAYLLHDRARALRDAGDYAASIAVFAAAEDLTTSIFGAQHLNLADVHESHALALDQLGQRKEARDKLRAAEAIRRAALRGDHPAVAQNLALQGELALNAGAAADAVAAFAAAEVIYERAAPDNLHVLASVAGQRAVAAMRAGDADGAVAHGRRAQDLYAHIAGGAASEDHAAFLERFAYVLASTGHGEEARAAVTRSLALRRQLHGPDHPQIAQALHMAAQIEGALGSYDQALVLADEALAVISRAGAPDVTRVGLYQVTRGTALAGLGRRDEAVHSLTAGLTALTQAGAPANLIEVFINAALALDVLREHSAAVSGYREAFRLVRAHLPAANPLHVVVRRLLGRSLSRAGEHAEAVMLLDEAIAVGERSLANDDPALVEARETAATVRANAERARKR
jgi:serine/threonine protein kinase